MSERTSKMTQMSAATAVRDGGLELVTPDFARITASMMNGLTAMNSRLMAFAHTSIQTNMAAAEEYRHCQSPRQMVDVHLKMSRKAYEDCLDEARALGTIMSQMSTEAVDALTVQK